MLQPRRFPPPWSIEEYNNACFIVKDAAGQALAYVYFEDEPGRQSAAKLRTRDEARRSTMEVSSTTNRSQSSGLSSPRLKLPPLGSTSSSRWMVFASKRRHSMTLDPVKFTQSRHKRDRRHLCRRLSARRHRPSSRSPHEKCYEIPPFHRPSPRQRARRADGRVSRLELKSCFSGLLEKLVLGNSEFGQQTTFRNARKRRPATVIDFTHPRLKRDNSTLCPSLVS